jgi:hypothetical protein
MASAGEMRRPSGWHIGQGGKGSGKGVEAIALAAAASQGDTSRFAALLLGFLD